MLRREQKMKKHGNDKLTDKRKIEPFEDRSS
jgi:hypothetical protein